MGYVWTYIVMLKAVLGVATTYAISLSGETSAEERSDDQPDLLSRNKLFEGGPQQNEGSNSDGEGDANSLTDAEVKTTTPPHERRKKINSLVSNENEKPDADDDNDDDDQDGHFIWKEFFPGNNNNMGPKDDDDTATGTVEASPDRKEGVPNPAFIMPRDNRGFIGATSRRDNGNADKRSINKEQLDKILDNVRHRLGDLSKRYSPLHKMFEETPEVLNALTLKKKELLAELQVCRVKGVPAFNLSRVSENDAMRVLDDLQYTPGPIKDKLTEEGGLESLSSAEIGQMPVSVFPTMTDDKLTELSLLDEANINLLCEKLTVTGSSPWTLWAVMKSGINCMDLTLETRQLHTKKKPMKKDIGYAVSKMLMTYMREAQTPETWNSDTFVTMTTAMKEAITAEDIAKVPEEVVREGIRNISSVEFPYKSQVRTLVNGASAVFSTPTSWPENFITDLGQLLDQVDIGKVALLRNNALYNVAEELQKVGFKRNLTKLVLSKGIHDVFRRRSNYDSLHIVFPWLKGEIDFIKSLDLYAILNTFKNNNFSSIPFTPAEKHMLAHRVEDLIKTEHLNNDTDDYVLALSDLLEGFSNEYLEWIPDHMIPNITKMAPVTQVSKARLMARKLRRSLRKERLATSEAKMLFSGLDISDIENMTIEELKDSLPVLRDLDLPFHIGRKVVKKLERSLLSENRTGCNSAFSKMGKLARHISPQVLEEESYVPVHLDEDLMEECQQRDVMLKKSQAYAVMDNLREMLKNRSGGDSIFNANILQRLGHFAEGLSVEDIESLPLDTELLSIIEVMSDLEDDLTSAQTEAIVQKIRDNFDWNNRVKITEASDVMIAQIGRFLQYLNPEYELPKFPKSLRPAISREIGKSSLLKISSGQRQKLLMFALKNAASSNGSVTDLMLGNTIDNRDIEDLGSIKCGLTPGVIAKLSQEAIDLNMADFQNCPLKDDVFEALTRKAVDLNINRLVAREGLGNMAPMLQYLSESDIRFIDKKELSSIASYVSSSMDQLDSQFEKTEKNGFISERNHHSKELHKTRRKHFANKLYNSMVETQSKEDCSVLLFMGSMLPDITESMDVDLKNCIEAVGTLPNWEKSDARKLLETFLNKHGKALSSDSLSSMDQDMIIQTAGFLKGLTDTEMSFINFTDINTLANVDAHDFTDAQIQNGFESWQSYQMDNGHSNIEEDDLASMQNFACGMSASHIQRSLTGATVRNCLDGLGKRRCFKQDQTEALANKMMQSMSSKPIANWKTHLVADMGHLIGGLPKDAFQQLTKYHMKVIEPEVITALAPEKVQDITVEQMEALSPNQAAAFTTMQRSFMSEEQVNAIGRSFINGADQIVMANTTVIVILLSLLRQVIFL